MAGATTIVAVDVDDRKLERGQAASARRIPSTPARGLRSSAIRELTGGFGADVVVEAVGRPETYEQAFYARDLAGTVVLVGVPTPGHAGHAADDRDLRSRRVAEVAAGTATACPPATSPCWSTSTARAGFDLDAFVTETIGLGDVEAAFETMKGGDVLRSVVRL